LPPVLFYISDMNAPFTHTILTLREFDGCGNSNTLRVEHLCYGTCAQSEPLDANPGILRRSDVRRRNDPSGGHRVRDGARVVRRSRSARASSCTCNRRAMHSRARSTTRSLRASPKAEVTSSNLEQCFARINAAEALRKHETRRNRTLCRILGSDDVPRPHSAVPFDVASRQHR